MNKKKFLTFTIVTVVVGLIVFLIINLFMSNDDNNSNNNSNSNLEENNNGDTIVIDYTKYQELRSEVYENEVFAIVIMDSEDEVSKTFKEEILYSFKDRKAKVYEIDTDKLSDTELSGVIDDITNIMDYDEPTIVTPTLLVSKKGKIVYKQEGLTYSPDIISNLDKEKIE